MSRSHKKHPYTGFTCSDSEKEDKVRANRKLRREENTLLRNLAPEEAEELILPLPNEVENPYSFAKDGKQYIGENFKKRDPQLYRKMLAK